MGEPRLYHPLRDVALPLSVLSCGWIDGVDRHNRCCTERTEFDAQFASVRFCRRLDLRRRRWCCRWLSLKTGDTAEGPPARAISISDAAVSLSPRSFEMIFSAVCVRVRIVACGEHQSWATIIPSVSEKCEAARALVDDLLFDTIRRPEKLVIFI